MASVSIITPVYNAEQTIRECIESVRGQVFQDWEQILVDDCSTDSSKEIIEEFALRDPRIKYIGLNANSGPGVARNKAIEMASGRFIAFLDCDDIWYPEKLEKQVSFMLQNAYPFSFSSYDCMDETGQPLNRKVTAPGIITYKRALFKNPIGCLTAVYDVDFFGKQYMPSIRKRQDFALWLKLLKKSDAHGIKESLARYRIQKNSVSSNKLSLVKYEWMIYRKEEGLSVFRSTFYVFSAIILKLKSYF